MTLFTNKTLLTSEKEINLEKIAKITRERDKQ